MNDPFEYTFPAIQGVQARREYYVSMCPLRLIPKIFLFNEEELVPELRAQRILNKARLPEIARYIIDNRDDYVFSALTASVDADARFEPMGSGVEGKRIGLLHIPMTAAFIINDGQHRRAAIEMALRETPDIADERIAVVFFLDKGLKRSQQMFADLNRYAIRPSRSLGVLYDHRDSKAELARLVAFKSQAFKDVVEMEKTTLSARARRLFTLSAIYNASSALIANIEQDEFEKITALTISFWNEVAKHIPEWKQVQSRKISAGEVRRDFIHSHGVVLQAIGNTGNALLLNSAKTWKKSLQPLRSINWSRSNHLLWEGRAMNGGKVANSQKNIMLTGNAIKMHLKIALTPDEQKTEDHFLKGLKNGKK